MSDAFIGEIRLFPYTYTPMYFGACNGALVNIQQYQALFAVIGNAFGGNAQTTFGLPNLQGRAAMSAGTGVGLSPRNFAAVGGDLTVSLNQTQIPAHSHALMARIPTDAAKVTDAASNAFLSRAKGTGGGALQAFNDVTTPNVPMAQALAVAGGGAPHPNTQPYAVIGFCIALEGVFPSRN